MSIRHAIIGCGRVAKNHLNAIRLSGKARVTHFCDILQERGRCLATDDASPAVVCDDFHEIISSSCVDSVSVCTDHASHFEIAKLCIENQKHVLIEKPICIRDIDAQILHDLSSNYERVVTVVSQHRYDPLVAELHRLCTLGLFGQMVSITGFIHCCRDDAYYSGWRGKLSTEGGSALMNQGYHTIDIMIWFAGPVVAAHAHEARIKFPRNETEDTLCAAILFSNGTLGSLMCSTASSSSWTSHLEVVGTDGHFGLSLGYPTRLISLHLPKCADTAHRVTALANAPVPPPLGMRYYGASHTLQINNFFAAVRDEEPLKVTLAHALDTLHGINVIYRAARGH